jgi:hypothetical protein
VRPRSANNSANVEGGSIIISWPAQ